MSQVLLERMSELAAIDEAVAAARSGAERLVAVEGAAGIGGEPNVGRWVMG